MSKKQLFSNYLNSLSVKHESPERQSTTDNEDLFAPDNDVHDSVVNNHNKFKNMKLGSTSSVQQAENMQKAIITKDMIITGSVEVISDMNIYGVVHGNVISQGNLLVAGLVEGDIMTKGLTIETSKMQGNIAANDYIEICENCEIEGDITSKDIIINGTVRGNIKASGHVALKEKAIVTGDLHTGSLEIMKGAVMNGKVTFSTVPAE